MTTPVLDSDRELTDEPAPIDQELKAAAVHGLRWASMGRLAVELMLLTSMVVLARLIPPDEFGPYAVAIVVQELALGMQSQGLGNAIVQHGQADRVHLQTAQALALVFGIGLAALTFAAAGLVAQPIFGAPTASLVRLSAPLCIVAGLSIVPTSILRRGLDFRRLAAIDVSSNLVRVGASIALAAVGLGAKSLVLGTLAATLVGAIAAWAIAPPPLPRLNIRAARELMRYGGPASLASVSWVCFRNCDYAIVGARVGTTPAGLYYRAYQLAVEYQKKVSDLMVTVAFPILSRARTPEEQSVFRSQMVQLLTLVLFPLLALLTIVAPEFIPWLLGSDWAPAVLPTQILAIGGAATLVTDTAGVALAASGRSKAMLGFGVSHFVVYALAVWFVAPHGIAAVAIVAAIIHTIFLLVSYIVMLFHTPEPALRRLASDVTPATAASLVLAVVAVPLNIVLVSRHAPVPVEVLVVALGGLLAYAALLRTAFPSASRLLVDGIRRIVPFEHVARAVRRRPSIAGANTPAG